ncbi:MAG: YdcF family protein [Candidatus Omnitrophica bacterium]|nr:YdcF family protein [Candidatus Omnitrophota bacterium]
MVSDRARKLGKILWDYHRLDREVSPAEVIFTLGSHDTRVADRAGDLFLEGFAPWLIFSGGYGNFTQGVWDSPEAEIFARRAIARGVPEDRILIENRSTNTGENVRFTQTLLHERSLDFQSFILVQKPYMERRTIATFERQWPGKIATVTSPLLSYEDYPTSEIPLERVLNIMVGDLQRIEIYPDLGFQTYQEIPERVREVFLELIEMGYNSHLCRPL